MFVISMGQGTYQDRQLLWVPPGSFNQIKELDRGLVNLPLLKSKMKHLPPSHIFKRLQALFPGQWVSFMR